MSSALAVAVIGMAQRSVIPHRGGEHVESKFAVICCQIGGNFIDLVDVVSGKRVNKNCPGISPIIFYLSAQHVFGVADLQAGFIISPYGDMYFILDGLRDDI